LLIFVHDVAPCFGLGRVLVTLAFLFPKTEKPEGLYAIDKPAIHEE